MTLRKAQTHASRYVDLNEYAGDRSKYFITKRNISMKEQIFSLAVTGQQASKCLKV